MDTSRHRTYTPHVDAAGCDGVVNGLSLGVQSAAHTAHRVEAPAAPAARNGERFERPDGLRADGSLGEYDCDGILVHLATEEMQHLFDWNSAANSFLGLFMSLTAQRWSLPSMIRSNFICAANLMFIFEMCNF